jgi:hypothetical protein
MSKQQYLQLSSCLILFLCSGSFSAYGQTITKESILRTFAQGDEVAVAILEKDIVTLNKLLGNTEDARSLLSLRKTEEASEEKYNTRKDIYYHPDIESYIFTIHCAQWIKTDSDWGLNDYLYVLEMRLNFDPETETAEIAEYHLLQNKKDLKNWWRSLMASYNHPKFLRNQWAKDFNLVPPPPPPPGYVKWLKG